MGEIACARLARGGQGPGETRGGGRAAARCEQRAADLRRVQHLERPQIVDLQLGRHEFRSTAGAAWFGH